MLTDGPETFLTDSKGEKIDLNFEGHLRVSYTVGNRDVVVMSWKGVAQKEYTIKASGLSQ